MTYVPMARRSFTGTSVAALNRGLFLFVRAPKETWILSREEAIDETVQDGFGPLPEMEDRKRLLYLMMYGGILLGFAIGVIGLAVGAVVQVTAGQTDGNIARRAFGVLGSAPALAMGIVWAGRAQLNDIDYNKWVKAGRAPGHVPAGRTQPKDRDLLYAAPLAVLFAIFFISA